MNNPTARGVALALALILGSAAITACSPDPQEQYEDATEALEQAREARNDAQEKLNAKKEELSELRANLNEAEAELQAARKKVDEASQTVDKTVNDEVLFRTIQRELLDTKRFEDAAISVGVKNRVVTLTGNVPDEKTHKQALETARAQAGVKDVVDDLEIKNAESAPAENQNKSQNGGTSQSSAGGSGEPG